MSHVVEMEIEVKDLEALKTVLPDLGLEWKEGKKTYKWYGRHMGDYPVPPGYTQADLGKCDHAIGVIGNPQAYEVGVSIRDGKICLLWDFWAGGHGLEEKLGKNGKNLVREYSLEVARKQLVRKGCKVIRKKNAKGNSVLVGVRGRR